jgi:hypothetical protein
MVDDALADIPPPPAPTAPASVDVVVHGPAVLPLQRVRLYASGEWESFVHEWAYYGVRPRYNGVQRVGGARDRGIDIAGFTDAQKLQGVWDGYQCKHYARALRATDAWPDIGKVLWYSFLREYGAPRRYYFVSPQGAGTDFAGLLGDAAKLKRGLIEAWDKHCATKITDTQNIRLEGAFLGYVNAFDFSIFDEKSGLQMIHEHRASCPYYATRFGGGLPPRPAASKPPMAIAPNETRYVEQLLEAYTEHKQTPVSSPKALSAWPRLRDHFNRQREAFYLAESLRVFARDTVPPGTFDALQNEIYDGVIDTHDGAHADGYARVCAVTKAARELHLTANALMVRAYTKDRDGICHQLANQDILRWKH